MARPTSERFKKFEAKIHKKFPDLAPKGSKSKALDKMKEVRNRIKKADSYN